jgi:hypothetical protein
MMRKNKSDTTLFVSLRTEISTDPSVETQFIEAIELLNVQGPTTSKRSVTATAQMDRSKVKKIISTPFQALVTWLEKELSTAKRREDSHVNCMAGCISK